MQEVVPASDQELIELVVGAYSTILRTSRDILRLKFELGRLVTIHLQRHKYAHTKIIALARAISGICGKVIVPQRLYEAARYYNTFGGQLDRVWAFERRMSHPLTYTYLIRSIIPHIHKDKAWNADEWALYQDAQMSRLESAVQEIELLKSDRVKDVVQSDERQVASMGADKNAAGEVGSEPRPAEGLLEICRDSPGYQCFRASTLVSTIVQACQQLEAIDGELLEEDRRRLEGIVPILTKYVGSVRHGVAA